MTTLTDCPDCHGQVETALFWEYLDAIDSIDTREHEGRLYQVYDVEVDHWRQWLDPDSILTTFDVTLECTDYVPSPGLYYAAEHDDSRFWGSGTTIEEAITEAHNNYSMMPGQLWHRGTRTCGASVRPACHHQDQETGTNDWATDQPGPVNERG